MSEQTEREVKKCVVCKVANRRLHVVDINTCLQGDSRRHYLCCKCVNRLENWLDGRRMRYDK